MKFTDWYETKENSDILIIDKYIEDITKYKNFKYDYIYLNGTIENANNIMQSENKELDFIKYFKELLKENGKLFIAVDNKFGVKYFAGNKSEHCNNIYDSLKNKFNNGKIFSKSELDKLIDESGFKYKKYYYPLPNYEIPNVIFTDEFLPTKNYSKINYNVIYNENSLVVQDEINLLKIFIEQNKFVEFTNSYIIELSNEKIQEEVKYYSFNNMRKDKYSLILKMKNDYIEKYPRTQEALEHIKKINDNSKVLKKLGFTIAEVDEEEKVKSKFINLELLDKQIIEQIYNGNLQNLYEIIENWYRYIYQRLEVNEQGITKYGFIDLVFENTFYDKEKNEYVFFDQEWYKENVKVKFILYRAIRNIYEHNPKIEEKVPCEKLFKRFEINEEEFSKQEEDFQNEIIDKEKQKYYSQQYQYKISSEELKRIIKDIKKLDKDNIELTNEVKRLESQIMQKDKIIDEQQKQINDLNENLLNKLKRKIFNKGK